jgi:hypothetical protein
MNWGGFDLDLLILFDSILQERHVTRAVDRVSLSCPSAFLTDQQGSGQAAVKSTV